MTQNVRGQIFLKYCKNYPNATTYLYTNHDNFVGYSKIIRGTEYYPDDIDTVDSIAGFYCDVRHLDRQN